MIYFILEPIKFLYPSKTVRLDSKSRTLHSFLSPPLLEKSLPIIPSPSLKSHDSPLPTHDYIGNPKTLKRAKVDVRLKSILRLRELVRKEMHSGMRSPIGYDD
jgi:hypothetical protein